MPYPYENFSTDDLRDHLAWWRTAIESRWDRHGYIRPWEMQMLSELRRRDERGSLRHVKVEEVNGRRG